MELPSCLNQRGFDLIGRNLEQLGELRMIEHGHAAAPTFALSVQARWVENSYFLLRSSLLLYIYTVREIARLNKLQRCIQPPEKGMAWPTKKLLSSLARNSANSASSRAVASRPSGT